MKRFVVLVTLCVSFLLVACSGNAVLDGSLNDQGVPTWVGEGSSILKSRQGRLFHGRSPRQASQLLRAPLA